jgi:hypothetical protein
LNCTIINNVSNSLIFRINSKLCQRKLSYCEPSNRQELLEALNRIHKIQNYFEFTSSQIQIYLKAELSKVSAVISGLAKNKIMS